MLKKSPKKLKASHSLSHKTRTNFTNHQKPGSLLFENYQGYPRYWVMISVEVNQN